MKDINLKDTKSKVLILIGIVLVTTIIISILFKTPKKEVISEDQPINENKITLDTGSTKLKSNERYNLILEKLAKREELINLEDKYNNKKIKTNARIEELKKDGIRTDIIELLSELKKEELLEGDDKFFEDSNILKIGKIGDESFSYEIKIKSIEEILKQEVKREEQEEMIPLSEYVKQKEKEE